MASPGGMNRKKKKKKKKAQAEEEDANEGEVEAHEAPPGERTKKKKTQKGGESDAEVGEAVAKIAQIESDARYAQKVERRLQAAKERQEKEDEKLAEEIFTGLSDDDDGARRPRQGKLAKD